MREKLLEIVPEKWRCPWCGKIHKYKLAGTRLIDATREAPIYLYCENRNSGLSIFCKNGYLYYRTNYECNRIRNLDNKILISEIKEEEQAGEVAIYFEVEFKKDAEECWFCWEKIDRCKIDLNITQAPTMISFILKGKDVEDILNEEQKRVYKKENTSTPITESENAEEIKKEVIRQEPLQINVLQKEKNANDTKKKSQETNVITDKHGKEKEKTINMNNDIFNMNNMGFGLNKDEKIASTIMGIAVKKNDSWRIYDKKKKQITNYGSAKFGDFPIFIIPSTELDEGDLIKEDEEYYFVTKVEENEIEMISATTGQIKNNIQVKNFFGFGVYAKVMAITDSINLNSKKGIEKIALMLAMTDKSGKENGNKMNQLLLMLLLNSQQENDISMENMLLISIMMENGNNNQMTQLLPIMCLGNQKKNDNAMERALLMLTMTNNAGNDENSNSTMMNFLTMSMLMGKKGKKGKKNKKDKKKKTTAENTDENNLSNPENKQNNNEAAENKVTLPEINDNEK